MFAAAWLSESHAAHAIHLTEVDLLESEIELEIAEQDRLREQRNIYVRALTFGTPAPTTLEE